jgi:ribonuclease HI
MSVPAPHFLLYAEAAPLPSPAYAGGSRAGVSGLDEGGRWRFVLRLPGGETSLEAADEEPEATAERLELLAVVRGLEALSQPSRVTLLTGSRHLRRGLEFGLSQWRENDWQWERYGRMSPIKNCDLWQRLDRLLEIHVVQSQPTRLEKADDLASPPAAASRKTTSRGRHVRIDSPEPPRASKHEIQSAKSKTNSKFKFRKAPNKIRWSHLNFLISSLFRNSNFVLRIWSWGNQTARKRNHR